ncbi:hypothetical protein N7E81_06485 [Reichenbachiella carrageenanivorans]|uniref:Uncharacterized protein n=1 Tax=Reichenbachiella carrageenanivorans TaxID=2979869 RepID=A0ABY6D548_9BACT|nr:hypothetical protein [Reichenbachiella carrageenanivorans]UXX80745.1 hypothetical protein N7E81_06485 [Reichenbachiella carrageenanivorans]
MSKKNKNTKPKVNPALKGFEVNINSFGEIKSTLKIDELNAFLNDNVEDKKLKDREDLNPPK